MNLNLDPSAPMPEITDLKKYFELAKRFPQRLVTQNKAALQHAYLMVPMDIWAERVFDLQEALQSSRAGTTLRRSMVTYRSTGMTPLVDAVMDKAFLEKYDELMERIIYDFDDFFPYTVTGTSQKIIVFEKLRDTEMIQYVLKKF